MMNSKIIIYVRPASYYGSLFDTLVKHHIMNELNPFIFIDMEHDYENMDVNTILSYGNDIEVYYLTHVNGTLPNNVHELLDKIDNKILIKEINWASLFRHKQVKINENVDWMNRHTLDEDETFEQCSADFIEITERM